MRRERAFVYAVCGAAAHIRTLQRSLEYLRPQTSLPIIVVTDSRRNEISIEHSDVVDVETPANFNNHQASIFLKTSLHRFLPPGRDYAYIDTDVIAAEPGVDTIFDNTTGPITFARDLNFLRNRVGVFSPWAMNCSCSEQGGQPCSHLSEAISRKFGVTVPDDWVQWNGGVFVFGPESTPILDTWHRFTMDIFQDPHWRTRDQGTLIAAVWTHGLQHQAALPAQYDFMVDEQNEDLRFDREKGFSLHKSIPFIRPILLHLYHADLDRPGWTLVCDVKEKFAARAAARVALEQIEFKAGPALGMVSYQLGALGGPPRFVGAPAIRYRVIFSVPQWLPDRSSALVETLARSLLKRGIDVRVLITEQDTLGEPSQGGPIAQPASDIPFEVLALEPNARWGARWGRLIRYLEESSPCVYLPVGDWRHSNVSSQLSKRVGIVGVVEDDPRSYEEVERLGRYWNGAITATPALQAWVKELQPALTQRIVQLPASVGDEGSQRVEDLARDCERLFETLMQEAAGGELQRPKGLLRRPPYQAGGLPVFQAHYARGIRGVGVFPSYREDYELYREALGAPYNAQLPAWSPELVDAYPVLLGASGTPELENERLIEAMVHGLKRIDHPAIVLRAPDIRGLPAKLFDRELGALRPWRRQITGLAHDLESRAPCLYLPSNEPFHQSVCTQLSHRIAVIGRVDNPDPRQLERAAQVAGNWNAIVAGDAQIARELLRLDPSLSDRLVTIPLPAGTPARLNDQPLPWDRPLRVAHLAETGSPASDGDLARVKALVEERHVPMEWLPFVPDAGAAIFERADVFLVLPSCRVNTWDITESMRRGCIPVVARDESAPMVLLKDGENGYVLRSDDLHGFAARLGALQQNAALQRAVSAEAYATTDVFTTSYAILFERVLQGLEFGRFRRPELSHARSFGHKRMGIAHQGSRKKGSYAR